VARRVEGMAHIGVRGLSTSRFPETAYRIPLGPRGWPKIKTTHCFYWRSLRDSNACYSLEARFGAMTTVPAKRDSFYAIMNMMDTDTASRLLLEARRRAGLSQRALARRVRTAQSVVARIESGTASPSWKTLERLLRGAGFTLSATLTPRLGGRSHMLADVPRILRLTPEERLIELRNAARFFETAVRTSPP